MEKFPDSSPDIILEKKEAKPQSRTWEYFGASVAAVAIGGVALEAVDEGFKDYINQADHVVEMKLSNDELIKFKNSKVIIENKIGEGIFFSMVNRQQKAAEGEKVEMPNIEGFDHTPVSDVDIKKLIKETGFFPQGWFAGKVSSISYSGSVLETGKGTKSEAITGGENIKPLVELLLPTYTGIVITDFKYEDVKAGDVYRYSSLGAMYGLLAHESCHQNDWGQVTYFPYEKRVDLLAKIINRVDSIDPYTGNLRITKDDEIIPYYKISGDVDAKAKHISYKEYWADICSEYITSPSNLKGRYPKDFAIVDEYVRNVDPAFLANRKEGPYDSQTGEISPAWKQIFK